MDEHTHRADAERRAAPPHGKRLLAGFVARDRRGLPYVAARGGDSADGRGGEGDLPLDRGRLLDRGALRPRHRHELRPPGSERAPRQSRGECAPRRSWKGCGDAVRAGRLRGRRACADTVHADRQADPAVAPGAPGRCRGARALPGRGRRLRIGSGWTRSPPRGRARPLSHGCSEGDSRRRGVRARRVGHGSGGRFGPRRDAGVDDHNPQSGRHRRGRSERRHRHRCGTLGAHLRRGDGAHRVRGGA